MAKPIINQIASFDARSPYIITATYNGYLPKSNTVNIYEADSMKKVYSKTITTAKLSHTVPASTLRNGMRYAAEMRITEESGTQSSMSDKAFFSTLNSPNFWFIGMTGDVTTVESASYIASVAYTQAQGSKLYSYKFKLYDAEHQQLSESEMMYNNENGRINISYEYKGLETETYYYIACEGITESNVKVYTENKIFVSYVRLDRFTLFRVDCNTANSHMNYRSYIRYIEPNRTDYNYIGGWIDLRGDYVEYNKGFMLKNDWCIIIRGYKLRRPTEVLRLKNDKYTITFGGVLYTTYDFRFKLVVPNAIGEYIIYTEKLDFGMDDVLTIYIRKKNNVYSVNVINEGNYATLGRSDPMYPGGD